VSKVRILSGPCARQLVSFELDQLYFANPAAIEGELDGMTTRLPGESDARIGPSNAHPDINGWTFMYAELVEPMGRPGSVGSTYIGAWNRGSTGMLAHFKRTSETGFSEPREVLTSSLPVHSVSYFPFLHGGAGRLGLAQYAGTGIRLVSIEWAHPGL
jgi:hypothetical protein